MWLSYKGAGHFLERYPDFSIARHMDSKMLQREEDRTYYV